MDFDHKYFLNRKSGEGARLRQTDLDFEWVMKKRVSETLQSKKDIVFDFGCSDGYLLKLFDPTYFELHGLEINTMMQHIAGSKGIQMHTNINDMEEIDIFLMRGVLHHLPDYLETFSQLLKVFLNSDRSRMQIFLLANPNADSFLWRRFHRLPMVEEGDSFNSVYKVYSAKHLRDWFLKNGARVEIAYPYLRTPYRKLSIDLKSFLYCVATNKYRRFAWPRNIFNMCITFVK